MSVHNVNRTGLMLVIGTARGGVGINTEIQGTDELCGEMAKKVS